MKIINLLTAVTLNLGFWTSVPAAQADSFVEHCDAAQALGKKEGTLLFQSVLLGDRSCSMVLDQKLYFWLEAHTARMFLWNSGAFPALLGLEEVQDCRVIGQNAGIEFEQELFLTKCSLTLTQGK